MQYKNERRSEQLWLSVKKKKKSGAYLASDTNNIMWLEVKKKRKSVAYLASDMNNNGS